MNNNKINLLHIVLSLGVGGSEKLVLDICKGLNKTLFNPIVFSINNRVLRLKKNFESIGVKVLLSPYNKNFHFKIPFIISEIIKKKEIDIINTHNFKPLFYIFWGNKIKNRRI
ncbi:MAG: hypothetical protein ACFFDN_19420, partial [Candidatus Hodarchaeota archaeon]